MKFATLPNGTPDGRLHIVSRDLTRCQPATAAQTLQQALESWTTLEPALQSQSGAINAGAGTPFDITKTLAPCPAPGNGWTAPPSTAMAS